MKGCWKVMQYGQGVKTFQTACIKRYVNTDEAVKVNLLLHKILSLAFYTFSYCIYTTLLLYANAVVQGT